jgi:superfamily II DNA or RNA helicase
MLDEGVNLRDCQYGIFAMLNSSERMIIQKLGRLLRHKEPVVIIPYYVGTRDEELVKKMTENYKTTIINDLNSFKQWKQQKKQK